MLDPWNLLKNIKPKIEGDENTKKIKLGLIMEAITERNPDEYQKEIEKLRSDEATR